MTVVPNMWAGAVNGPDYKQEIEKAKQRIRKKIPLVQNAVSFSGVSFLVQNSEQIFGSCVYNLLKI